MTLPRLALAALVAAATAVLAPAARAQRLKIIPPLRPL
jgi:hypothetical protein